MIWMDKSIGQKGLNTDVKKPYSHISERHFVTIRKLTLTYDGKVSIGVRNITNLRIASDIDALAEEKQELQALVESLDIIYTRCKMEISAEKTKLVTNSATGIQREIKVKGQSLRAVVSDDGSKPEIFSKIAQVTVALTKLKHIWRYNSISLGSKVKLIRPLAISILLYACESWTFTTELEKTTQAFEMRCEAIEHLY